MEWISVKDRLPEETSEVVIMRLTPYRERVSLVINTTYSARHKAFNVGDYDDDKGTEIEADFWMYKSDMLPDVPEGSMNNDLISRSALKTVLERYYQAPHVHVVGSGISTGLEMGISGCLSLLDNAPAVDAVKVDAVAQMLYESFGDPHACNFNGNDEWLPMLCDNMNECPDIKDNLYCWKQFIKHYGERRVDE